MSILTKIFGDADAKYLKSLQPLVEEINGLESKFENFGNEELKLKTEELKLKVSAKASQGRPAYGMGGSASGGKEDATLDEILPEAFALTREAAKRTIKQRHFDVQLLGGLTLHRGQIAEMKTGEGKTLTATLPLYLNALSGQGCHLVTVNDYLARRDTVWMGQIYNLLGLSVACIQHDSAFLYDESYQAPTEIEEERDRGVVVNENFLRPVPRKEAYLADITYGTNNEFGFDYLRDNMVQRLDQMVQRDLTFAIVDEVDSILIDEARTPLIISGPAEESAAMYSQFARLVRVLKENEDYNIDEKMRAATLTEKGIEKIEKALGVKNIYEAGGARSVHHLEAALKAETLFKKDKDYVVKPARQASPGEAGGEGEVIIVDEFTGRLMHGRRYSEGLHQAIEAKEGVKVQRESVTMATITFQNYFRMYKKLSGMTGTAATEAEEFAKIYNLDVTIIPTNKTMVRRDLNDLIYKSEEAKFKAVAKEVKERQQKGQPVLLGTISIEKNEFLSELLSKEGVKHEILNAKNHEREATIIAQAGQEGSVTLATNMAGRGVDIILGGNPPDQAEAEKIKNLGGLHVIGTERHEARRIDNQLRGRSGRQGDPGSAQFFVSLDDDLMRIFGSERIKGLMNTLKVPEDMPIENKMITKSIAGAQKRVEGHNFDIRKHLVEYDDVINKQRTVIYKKRRLILELADEKKQEDNNYQSLKEMIMEMIENEIKQLVAFHTAAESKNNWDLKEIAESTNAMFILTDQEKEQISAMETAEKLTDYLTTLAKERYEEMEKNVKALPETAGQNEPLRQIEKGLLLQTIDTLWIEHLEAIDYLRTGIGLRGYGQHDPLVEYKKESFNLFKGLLDAIQNQVVYAIFKVGQAAKIAISPMAKAMYYQAPAKTASTQGSAIARLAGQNQSSQNQISREPSSRLKDASGKKIGRNDPCPCGSGKKFKKCHGS